MYLFCRSFRFSKLTLTNSIPPELLSFFSIAQASKTGAIDVHGAFLVAKKLMKTLLCRATRSLNYLVDVARGVDMAVISEKWWNVDLLQ